MNDGIKVPLHVPTIRKLTDEYKCWQCKRIWGNGEVPIPKKCPYCKSTRWMAFTKACCIRCGYVWDLRKPKVSNTGVKLHCPNCHCAVDIDDKSEAKFRSRTPAMVRKCQRNFRKIRLQQEEFRNHINENRVLYAYFRKNKIVYDYLV